MTGVSPSCNVLLGEVDKVLLEQTLASSMSDIYLFTNDTNKGHDEHHTMDGHSWYEEHQVPRCYILTKTIIPRTTGKAQTQVNHHILIFIYGVDHVSGIMGDNASTQSGA